MRTASQHDHKVGAPRGQDTTTGDQQRQGNESAVERTARQHNHEIGAPRSQAEQHKPLRFARAKSLEQQSVEIERVPNSVNSKSKHKLNSVCGTEKKENNHNILFRQGDYEEEFDADGKCFSLFFSASPHDVKLRDFGRSHSKDNWQEGVQVNLKWGLSKSESADAA